MNTKVLPKGKKILAVILSLVFMLQAFPMGALAEGEGTDLVITVYDGNNKPFKGGASVTLKEIDKTEESDRYGDAHFSGVAEGTYTIDVTVEGKNVLFLGDSVTIGESPISKPVTLYTEGTYSISCKGETLSGGFSDISFDVSLTKTGNDDKAELKAEKKDNEIQVTYFEGYSYQDNYTLKVTPAEKDKYSDYVAENFTPDANSSTINFALNEYAVTINGEKYNNTDSYKYGTEISGVDFEKEGYNISSVSAKVNNSDAASDFLTKGDDGKYSFTVTGKTEITVAYNYTVEYSFGENGTVESDPKVPEGSDNLSVTQAMDDDVTFTVTPDAGYYIDSIKVDDSEITLTDDSTYTATVSKNTKVEVVFAERVFDFKVNLAETAKYHFGGAEVKLGDSSAAIEACNAEEGEEEAAESSKDASADVEIGVAYLNTETSNYDVSFTGKVDAGYKLFCKVNFKEGTDTEKEEVIFDEESGAYTLTLTAEQLADVESFDFTVEPLEYKVTFVDPIGEVKNGEETITSFTYSSDEKEIAIGTDYPAVSSVEGFTFIGWASAVPEAKNPAVIDSFVPWENSEDTEVYAVYTFKPVSVRGYSTTQRFDYSEDEGKLTKADYFFKIDNTLDVNTFEDVWFGSAVTIDIFAAEDVAVTAKFGDTEASLTEGTSDEGDPMFTGTISLVPAESKSTDVTVEATYTAKTGDYTFVYFPGNADDVKFTVNQSSLNPTVSTKVDKKIEVLPEVAEGGAEIESVGKVVLKPSDELKEAIETLAAGEDSAKVEKAIAFIKTTLRGIEDENWTKIDADTDGKYFTDLTKDDYVVFRVLDKAGNDAYSLFDSTAPEITYVKIDSEYLDKCGNINTDKDFVVTATVEDKFLGYYEDFKDYEGCQLNIRPADEADDTEPFVITGAAAEKFKLFGTKCEITFNVSVDDLADKGLTGKPLTLTVIAVDQAGNNAAVVVDKDVFVNDENNVPQITVNYSNGTTATEDGTDYINENIEATIVVSGDFFDPYAGTENKDKTSASVIVKINDQKIDAEDLDWDYEVDGWTGKVNLEGTDKAETLKKLEITAVNNAGQSTEFSSSVMIDLLSPEIVLEVVGAEYTNDNVYYNNGNDSQITVDVTVTDSSFDPFTGTENSAANVTVKVGDSDYTPEWEKTASQWKGTVTVPADEGITVVKVNAVDQAGNAADEKSVTVNNDNSAPVISALSLVYDTAKTETIPGITSIGSVFNQIAYLTIKYNDGENGAGVAALMIIDGSDREYEVTEKDGVFFAALPLNDVAAWADSLKIKLTDNVGNTETYSDFSEFAVKTNAFLYETAKPEVKVDGKDTEASGIFYTDDSGAIWLMKGKDVTFTVSDVINERGLNSGLISVKAAVGSNEVVNEAYSMDAITESDNFSIANNNFSNGENVVKIDMADRAGNTDSKSYSIFLDNTEPEVKGLQVTASTTRPYGNFDKSKITLKFTVEDNNASSGIDKVKVFAGSTELGDATLSSGVYTFDITSDNLPYSKDISIKVVDNVGNTFMKDLHSINGELSSSILIETDKPVSALENDGKTFFEDSDGKLWLLKDKSVTIDFNDNVAAVNSGLKDTTVEVGSYSKTDSLGETSNVLTNSMTIKYGDGFVEGKNTVIANATDNAGNELTENNEYVIYKDTSAPVITSVTLTPENSGSLETLLRKLSFGNFFHEKVKLTVVCVDKPDGDNSGVKTVTLYGKNNVVIKNFALTDDIYVVTLPKEDVEMWKDYLSVDAIDNVGNRSDKVTIDNIDLGDDVLDDFVLYETNEPDVKLPDTTDSNTFYTDANASWVKKGQSFEFVISDYDDNAQKATDYSSGLNNSKVILKNNSNPDGFEFDSKNYIAINSSSFTFEDTVTFAYTDLDKGENLITVTAQDNAGNEMAPVTFKVYKDDTDPVVDSFNLGIKEGSGNILNFGNFSNDDVTAEVSASDAVYSSGIASIEVKYVYGAGDRALTVNTKNFPTLSSLDSSTNASSKSTLNYIDQTEGTFEIIVTDNVGNSFTFDNSKDLSTITTNIKVNHLMLEKAPLAIETVPEEAVYTCKDCNKLWYNSTDVDITYNITDTLAKMSGINTVIIKINDKEALNTTIGNTLSADTKDTDDSFTVNLSQFGKEGENIITVYAVDNAGNVTEDEIRLYVDTVKPVVEGFSFAGPNGGNPTSFDRCETVEVTDYGFYFSDDTTVTVHVSDAAPSSGVGTVYFFAVAAPNADDSDITTEKVIVSSCNIDSTVTEDPTFIVPARFKGQVYAYVVDNVKNSSLKGPDAVTSNMVHPDGVIVETQTMHDNFSKHIKVEAVTQPITYLNGDKNPLYNNDATVRITVDDDYAGIRSINFKVESTYDTGNNFTGEFKVENGANGWTLTGDEVDSKLITLATRDIVISNNSNDIKVTVEMEDMSGNKSSNADDPFILSIDKDAPVITVSYNPDDSGDDGKYTGYFKDDRVLTVTVKERNFDQNLVKIVSTKNGAALGVPSSFATTGELYENGSKIYTMTYRYTDDADYTFAISASDLATNQTNDENVNYGTEAAKTVAKKFTIDHTAPVITIDLDGEKADGSSANNGEKEQFFTGATITVTIKEHNYAEDRYDITFETKNYLTQTIVTGEVPSPVITHNGDVWEYSYYFDSEYSSEIIGITVTDKAGNATSTWDGSYDSGMVFVIDKTIPVVTLYLKDNVPLAGTATADDIITPIIVVDDTNVSSICTATLTGSRGNVIPVSVIATPSGTTLRFTLPNFSNAQEIDDIYTLDVTAVDLAGQTGHASAVFSVNRYGATYMVNEPTKKVCDAEYVNNVPENVEIIQINASPILPDTQKVSISRNGIVTDLEAVAANSADGFAGKYTVESSDDYNGNLSKWYENRYTVYTDNFVEEGAYNVTVSGEDSSKNVLTSDISNRTLDKFANEKTEKMIPLQAVFLSTSMDTLRAPVSFTLDKTNPIANILDLEDGAQYFVSNQAFTYSGSDDVALDNIAVYVCDAKKGEKDVPLNQSTKMEPDENVGVEDIHTLTLKESDSWQLVQVKAIDKAGNESVIASANIQVTQSVFKWIMGNTLAKILISAGVAALAIFFIILFKRKKDKDEEKQASAANV